MTSDEQPGEQVRPETGGASREGSGRAGQDDRDEASHADGDSVDDTLPRILATIASQVGEIRDQLERLLNIQVDRLKLRLRSGLLWVLSGLLFAAVCVTATAVAVLFLLEGTAGAFTELFRGRAWAGDLAAGGLVLLVVLLAIGMIHRRHRRRELVRLKRKYESGAANEKSP